MLAATQRIGILVYIFVIVQNSVTMTALLIKAKRSSARTALAACHASIALWLLLGIFEILYQNTHFFPAYIRYSVVILYFPGPLWLLFTLEHLKIISRKRRFLRWIILAPAVLSVVPSLSDRLLFLVIRRIETNSIVAEWGILLYVHAVILFACITASALLLLFQAYKDVAQIKIKILLIISLFVPLVTTLLNYYKLIPDPEINVVPVTLTFFSSIVAVAIFKYKLIDIKPLASTEIYENARDAVLIVDESGKMIDINPAGRHLFGSLFALDEDMRLGGFLERLGAYLGDQELISRIRLALSGREPIRMEENLSLFSKEGEQREYACQITPLLDASGQPVGRILCFSDMTEYRLAAVNNERTRLAADLHDSIGHCLNTIIMSLEYVIRQKQCQPELEQSILTSYDRSINALEDLRRIVHELKPLDLEKNNLIWALENLFGKNRHMGVDIRFIHDHAHEQTTGKSKYDEAIYFICKEAVHNAIKHGQAMQIDVILKMNAEGIHLYISDNGNGCQAIVEGIGLGSMRRRIKDLGGSIAFGSPSGGGFNLVIKLPDHQVT